MNTRILAATLSAFAPGKMNGVNASAKSSTSSSAVSTRLRGKSLERSFFSMRALLRQRVNARRPPQQDGHHERDVGKERRLRHEEARVVGHEADEQCTDQRTRCGAQPADDQHDEDQ